MIMPMYSWELVVIRYFVGSSWGVAKVTFHEKNLPNELIIFIWEIQCELFWSSTLFQSRSNPFCEGFPHPYNSKFP